MKKTAILPGGFKPPHKGHYAIAKILSEEGEVLVRVGSGERDGITQDMSIKIWKIYGFKAKPAAKNSPIHDVFTYVEKEADEKEEVIVGTGEKDYPRFKALSDPNHPKYPLYNPRKISFREIKIKPQGEGISASDVRKALKNNDKKTFQEGLPDGIDKDKVWNIVTGLEEDLYNPEDKVNDYMRSSEFKAGYKKKGKITPAYKYKRGGLYTGGGMGFGGMYESNGNEDELHIYDFDDTIAKVKANIRTVITSPNDPDFFQELEISSTEFPEKSKELEARLGNLDITYDFSEFEKDIEDAIINSKVLNKLKASLSNPSVQTTILTARTEGDPVENFFKEIGLDPFIVPLGSMVRGKKVTGQDKANWIEKRIKDKKDVKRVYFIDDSEENRTAVSALKDKYPNIKIKIENPAEVSELMGGMMTEPEKKKHAKNLKRLKKDLKKQGDRYMKVPDYLKGTLTRKYYEEISERKLTKGELKDRERIAQDLPDAEFKKRYGKDWKSVKIATATKLAKKNEIQAGTGEIYVYNEIGINLKNHDGQVLPGDIIRAPKGFSLGGKKLEKSLELKVIKNSRKGINKYRLSLEDPKTGKKYSVMNFKMDGKYKGKELPQWSMVRRSKQNIKESSKEDVKTVKDAFGQVFDALGVQSDDVGPSEIRDLEQKLSATPEVWNSQLKVIAQWFKDIADKAGIDIKEALQEKSNYVKKYGKDPVKGTGKKPKGSGRRLYTDENPSDTVKVKFSTRQDIIDTLNKASFKSKPHKRQSQIINLIHQRVRAALNKAKDPAVKKRLRSGFEYIKKRKEASKRKTQRMKKENTFTKDWWKEIIIEQVLLTEGGAAGHMNHPFDDRELTFAEMKELVRRSLKGELNIEADVTEKTDGQNLAVTYKNGKVGAARNKATIREPMDVNAVASKFEGRGDIEKAFTNSMKDLENALKELDKDTLANVFKNGTRFLNIEIIYPATKNVITYGPKAYLQFNGLDVFDLESAKKVNSLPVPQELKDLTQNVNARTQDTFEIIPPKVITAKEVRDFDKRESYYINQIETLQKEYSLGDDDPVLTYHEKWWENEIDNKFPNVTEEEKDALVRRWASFKKDYPLRKIADENTRKAVIDYDKQDFKGQNKKNVYNFEKIFLELGVEVLSNINNYLAVNPKESVKELRKDIQNVIKQIKNSKDLDTLNKLKYQLKRIEDIGGFDKLVPSEGIVFIYKGKTYKLTGLFAPVNQLLGLTKYV